MAEFVKPDPTLREREDAAKKALEEKLSHNPYSTFYQSGTSTGGDHQRTETQKFWGNANAGLSEPREHDE